MTTLLCPLCSKSQFDTLEALRGRLVRAATQNILCPICGDVLLGLDKFTIHLFGHSIPPSEPPDPPTPVQPPETPLPSTVNMEDLSFLTSWENCWKQSQQTPVDTDESSCKTTKNSDGKIKQLDDPVDLFLEIKHENSEPYQPPNVKIGGKVNATTNCNSSPTSGARNKGSGYHLSPELHQDFSNSLPNNQIHQYSNEHPLVMQAAIDGNLIHQQLNIEKFIDPRLLHEPSVSKLISSGGGILHSGTEKNKLSQFDEARLQYSPNTDSPPSLQYDGDSTLLMTPSPKGEEGHEGPERSGEVKELTQYMAGFLRLEGMPQQITKRDPLELAPRFQQCDHSEQVMDQNRERIHRELLQHQLDPSQKDRQQLDISQSVRKKPKETSQGIARTLLPEVPSFRHESTGLQQSTRHQILRQERGVLEEESLNIQGLAQRHIGRSTPKQKQRMTPQNAQELLKAHKILEQTTQDIKPTGQQELHPKGPLGFIADFLEQKQDFQEQPKEDGQLREEREVNKETYVCPECGKSFRMRGSLVVHVRVAHAGRGINSSSEPRNFLCSLCLKAFKKEQHLSQHLKTHDGKQWQCETCSKFFTTKYFLKKHQRLHTGEMPYCCETCGKTFTFQQSYHKHLLYHSADKPHECRECGRAFKELSTLHNHQRIHSGEKPFACETCGKCFRQRVSYIVHQRIHTGVLPYQCTACSKKFRYKVSQRSHKCTAQPPGVVVRQPGDLIQRLLEQRRLLQCPQ